MAFDFFITGFYIFVYCFQTNEIGVTEHIEGDECKFALWSGNRIPISDYKIILKVRYDKKNSFFTFCKKSFILKN